MKQVPITIVDAQDTIIWVKNKNDITSQDIYRVASLWIENSQWQVLLAQRSFLKKHHPGKWWPAVEGTIKEWSSYESTIIQRSSEEIWLDVKTSEIIAWKKIHIKTPYHHFNQTFKLSKKLDIPLSDFHIDTDEVQELKWWDKEELKNKILQSPQTFVTLLDEFWE